MFEKNKQTAVFTLPFPAHELPTNTKVYRTLLVPEWKETECLTIWEPRIRECIIGTPQKKYIDFDNSYSPTADGCTIKCQIAYTAATDAYLFIVDIKNAFQNTIAKVMDRLYVTTPPTYLEWLHHEEGFQYSRDATYYRIMLNSNQGTRDAGNCWWNLLRKVLNEYKLFPTNVDHAFLVKEYPDKSKMFVSVATDDLLCTVLTYKHAKDFIAFIETFFTVSTQMGPVLNFLGLHIIQSPHCITMDQGAYVMEALTKFFGEDVDKVKAISTPMRYDSEFER